MKLHHSGFIVQNIDIWEKNMLFEKKLADIIDPLQNARLSLYTNFSNSLIELIQPLNKVAYTWNSLQKNGEHFNHFCYEISNEQELKEVVAKARMIKVLGPIPALLFDNRTIYFYYNRNKQIVEFLL
ncbi:MAG: VOC family protein [Bacteroidia bacterium]|nr:VOC family protein [Bacteroidia bacterium]